MSAPRLAIGLFLLTSVALVVACGSGAPEASVPDVEPVTKPMPDDDDWDDVEVEEDEEEEVTEPAPEPPAADAGAAPASDAAAPEGGTK